MTWKKKYDRQWENWKLYLILDYGIVGQRLGQVAQAVLAGGVKVIQLRAKGLSDAEFFAQAGQIARMARDNKAILIINDRPDIALAVEADGVHLGQEDMPLPAARQLLGKRIIGISTHNPFQAREAEKNGADYIGLGPIFETQTKPEAGQPVGVNLITQIKKTVSLPIIAIGGINEQNAAQVLKAGASGIAIASALLNQSDVKKATQRLLENIAQ